jgi:hypothetical protein
VLTAARTVRRSVRIILQRVRDQITRDTSNNGLECALTAAAVKGLDISWSASKKCNEGD